MKKNDSTEAFTHFVFSKIDPAIRDSLTDEQFNEIRKAVSASTPLNRHPIDIRCTIPLFFFKFYVVLLMGRDKRSVTRATEYNRRKQGDMLSSVVLMLAFMIPLLCIVLLSIYFYKSEIGIDIFPNHHLGDLFKN